MKHAYMLMNVGLLSLLSVYGTSLYDGILTTLGWHPDVRIGVGSYNGVWSD